LALTIFTTLTLAPAAPSLSLFARTLMLTLSFLLSLSSHANKWNFHSKDDKLHFQIFFCFLFQKKILSSKLYQNLNLVLSHSKQTHSLTFSLILSRSLTDSLVCKTKIESMLEWKAEANKISIIWYDVMCISVRCRWW